MSYALSLLPFVTSLEYPKKPLIVHKDIFCLGNDGGSCIDCLKTVQSRRLSVDVNILDEVMLVLTEWYMLV